MMSEAKTWLQNNLHTGFFLGKYLVLFTAGWFVHSIVSTQWFLAIALVLFVLFDICGWVLWFLLRSGNKHTITQLIVFYGIQVLALGSLWVAVFQPSLIADAVATLVNKLF